MPKRSIGQKIVDKFNVAKLKQHEDFKDIIAQGRDPFEYGYKAQDTLLVEIINQEFTKKFKKIQDHIIKRFYNKITIKRKL
jgi:NH3-dependent NAD+ synthetase